MSISLEHTPIMRSAAVALSRLAFSVLVVVLLGCDTGPGARDCPAVAEPAVEVEVSDVKTGRYVAAEAEAVITDGRTGIPFVEAQSLRSNRR